MVLVQKQINKPIKQKGEPISKSMHIWKFGKNRDNIVDHGERTDFSIKSAKYPYGENKSVVD